MPAAARRPAAPDSAGEAMAVLEEALGYLAGIDAAGLTFDEQAGVLRGLERATSRLVVARTRVLSAFAVGGGLEADGHCSARAWLVWQARMTRGAAGGAVGWMRRLAAHPVLEERLAAGELSESWGRQLAEWTDRLPEDVREDADQILVDAAAGGAALEDLAALAREMRERTAKPDGDGGRGFADRRVRLEQTFEGAGRLDGDLTPECAAMLGAVLESLGKRAGPEDDRTREQRDHDALEEGCRRLIGAGSLPDVAGQPTLIQLHVSLDELCGHGDELRGHGSAPEDATGAGAGAGGAAGTGLPATGLPVPGWLSGPAAQAYACDARIAPIVTGLVDPAVLARMTREFLAAADSGPPGGLPAATLDRLQDALLRYAVQVLSGPTGLAARLRAQVGGPAAAGVSLPLDTGTPTATVPPHLRRAVITRDRHCIFPGCAQPPAACQVHHIVPRSRGGVTALGNLQLLCLFHHLIAIHRWGWTLVLHGDGTTTATSPSGKRVLHSHGPPVTADDAIMGS